MTTNEWIIAIFVVFIIITTFIWIFITNYWKHEAKEARAEAAAYLTLLEAQRELVDGVLALNDTMLAERIEMYRLQEREFVTRTGIGNVH